MPVVHELKSRPAAFDTLCVATSQHVHLVDPLLAYFSLRPDYRLDVLSPDQSLDGLLGRLMAALDPVMDDLGPDIVMVQGDTTSALAGALSGFHRKVPVVHIEAGLRSGDTLSPFPEEMNRRLISRLATLHMAATAGNVATLVAEGVARDRIVLTGNPVVDALRMVLVSSEPSPTLRSLLAGLEGRRIIVLTAHRRENLGATLRGILGTVRDFVARHEDVALVFPVHPNPGVRAACERILASGPRLRLIEPMIYPDFLHLMSRAWLIASDSGGIQEEAPTLGKPVLILRDTTERPEVIACGCGKLAGTDPARLARLLEEAHANDAWARAVTVMANPFGAGDAAPRIVAALEAEYAARGPAPRALRPTTLEPSLITQ